MMLSSGSARRPTRFGSNVALLILLSLLPLGGSAAGQRNDEALVGEIARVLAAADARACDGPLFREAPGYPETVVRRQAALALGRIGDPAAVDLLVAALSDSGAAVRAAAAFALGLVKDARAVEPLLTLVRAVPAAEQGLPQAEAVTALAKIGGDAGARALRLLLGSGTSPGVPTSVAQTSALLEAWRLGAQAAPVPALLAYAQAPAAPARWHALYSLGRLRVASGVPALLRGLQDQASLVRAIALRGVTRALTDSANFSPRDAAAAIRPLLTDGESQVRINALRALATFRDTAIAGVALPLLNDADLNVVVQAETTLGVLGGNGAVEALRGRLASAVFAVRRQAMIALAQADSAAGAAAAVPLLTDGDWRWRRVAAEVFGAARDRSRLAAQLAEPDGRVVAQALQALARVVPESDTGLAPRARELLAHEDPAVRSVAADLLARHPSVADIDRLVQAYRRAAGDPFDDARLSAVAALAAIARSSNEARLAVATRFVSAVPKADDYLVRRLAQERFPDAAEAWGPAAPIATGRTAEDYRDVVRRLVLHSPGAGGDSLARVTIETDRGTMVVQLFPAEAPLTVAAFLSLVDRRYFDGSRWHRVVPNFVAQDGDPRGDGWGGPGFVLRDELNPMRYDVGTMGMALSGPDTGGSQFFITHSPQPHLDGSYTVFGRVVSGFNVLAAITQGDRIRSIHR